jgi:hypothetical protein
MYTDIEKVFPPKAVNRNEEPSSFRTMVNRLEKKTIKWPDIKWDYHIDFNDTYDFRDEVQQALARDMAERIDQEIIVRYNHYMIGNPWFVRAADPLEDEE